MKTILLIEDNEDHQELILNSLNKGLGPVEIFQADRTADAYTMVNERKYDLILSDYYLPDSNGEDHIKYLAEHAPDTPILVITGQGDEKTAARSIKAGADDYIVKTREALKSLPEILDRAFKKHQDELNKKQGEIKKELENKEEVIQKFLTEVNVIEEKIGRLQKLSDKDGVNSPPKDDKPTGMDSLSKRLRQLKEYVQHILHPEDKS